MILTLLNIELIKLFKKWRTFIGFIAIGVLATIMHLVMFYEGESFIDFSRAQIENSFFISGNLLNGYLLGYIVMQSLYIHLPFLVVLVGGDLLAGEATAGTYRVLLTRPISRFEIIFAKYLTGILYTFFLLVFLAFMSVGLGVLFFGSGELLVVSGKIIIYPADDVLWRFLSSYSFALLSMSVVAGLAFLFSSLVENSIGPIITSMAVLIVLAILTALDFDFIEGIKPYLFTTYLGDWSEFFRDPIDYDKLIKSGAILFAYLIGFFLVSFYIFRKKDILS